MSAVEGLERLFYSSSDSLPIDRKINTYIGRRRDAEGTNNGSGKRLVFILGY